MSENFNPIIGLILTCGIGNDPVHHNNFNPIIGLILTGLRAYLHVLLVKFQSHYRSDFNVSKTYDVEDNVLISIPL